MRAKLTSACGFIFLTWIVCKACWTKKRKTIKGEVQNWRRPCRTCVLLGRFFHEAAATVDGKSHYKPGTTGQAEIQTLVYLYEDLTRASAIVKVHVTVFTQFLTTGTEKWICPQFSQHVHLVHLVNWTNSSLTLVSFRQRNLNRCQLAVVWEK